jgi:hypothetical protein
MFSVVSLLVLEVELVFEFVFRCFAIVLFRKSNYCHYVILSELLNTVARWHGGMVACNEESTHRLYTAVLTVIQQLLAASRLRSNPVEQAHIHREPFAVPFYAHVIVLPLAFFLLEEPLIAKKNYS